MRSADGSNWVDKSITAGITEDFRSIASDGRGGLMVCSDNYVLFSYDGGDNWLVVNLPTHLSAASVCGMYANGRAVLFGTQVMTGNQGIALGQMGKPVAILSP